MTRNGNAGQLHTMGRILELSEEELVSATGAYNAYTLTCSADAPLCQTD